MFYELSNLRIWQILGSPRNKGEGVSAWQSVSHSELVFFHKRLKTRENQTSKFSAPVKFCLILMFFEKYFVQDCSILTICDALRNLQHLYNLKNVKNTHGGVLHFSRFLNCTKMYQLVQNITFAFINCSWYKYT